MRGDFSLFIPLAQVLQLVIQPHIALVAALGEFPLAQRLQHGAALFLRVAAADKAAVVHIRGKLRKRLRQVRLELEIQLLRVERGKARRVDHIGVLPEGEQLDVTRRVPPAAERLAHLADGQRQRRVARVEHARLAHTGVAGEGAEPAVDGRAQPVQPLARLRADAQHRDRRAAVDVIQLLRRGEGALVQTHKHLAALEPRDGAHAVDQVRIRHRDGGGGKDHQLVDVRCVGTE